MPFFLSQKQLDETYQRGRREARMQFSTELYAALAEFFPGSTQTTDSSTYLLDIRSNLAQAFAYVRAHEGQPPRQQLEAENLQLKVNLRNLEMRLAAAEAYENVLANLTQTRHALESTYAELNKLRNEHQLLQQEHLQKVQTLESEIARLDNLVVKQEAYHRQQNAKR